MEDRCQVCGARFRENEALRCHECGAQRRNTFLPEEPGGAPIPDAAASLATASSSAMEAVVSSASLSVIPAASTESIATRVVAPRGPAPLESAVQTIPATPLASAVQAIPATPLASAVQAIPATPLASAVQAAVPVMQAPAPAMQAGVPVVPAPASPMPAPTPVMPAAAPVPAAVPVPVRPSVSEPLPRPGGGRGILLWGLLGGALLAGGAIAAYVLLGRPSAGTEPEPEPPPISISARGLEPPGCAELEALAGSWVVTTTTTNARNTARVGMRGFFELEIKVKECSAEASLVKIGRKGKPKFADHKKPRATATLTPGVGFYTFGFGGHFELKNTEGQGAPLRITFAREGEQLVGAWRQVGPRWDSSGMYGVLVGERDGDPRKLRVRRAEQPCAIQCATPEALAEIDEPNVAEIETCLSSCG